MRKLNLGLIFAIVICLIFWGFVIKCFASEKRFVQIRFTEKTDIGEYSDCLYYPEGQVPEQKEIDRIKKERIDNWVNIVRNPPEIPETSEQDLVKEQASIDEQIASLTARKTELTDKIAVLQARPITKVITN